MKINEYVRTKKYGIAKIISNPNEGKFNIDLFKRDGITLRCLEEKDIIKSMPNITDLVEVGDYVNGMRVYKDEELNYLYVQCIDADGNPYQQSITKKTFIDNIKSIITHEQIEQVKYVVE